MPLFTDRQLAMVLAMQTYDSRNRDDSIFSIADEIMEYLRREITAYSPFTALNEVAASADNAMHEAVKRQDIAGPASFAGDNPSMLGAAIGESTNQTDWRLACEANVDVIKKQGIEIKALKAEITELKKEKDELKKEREESSWTEKRLRALLRAKDNEISLLGDKFFAMAGYRP